MRVAAFLRRGRYVAGEDVKCDQLVTKIQYARF